MAGNNYAGVSDYNFTTRAAPDTVAPTVATFSPTDEATGVAVGADIVVTFSEAVQRGTGNIVLKTSSGTVIATYDAASSTNLSISGSTLTINPTADFSYSTGYKVEFASGTIQDLAGNNYAGVSDYNFTTGIFDAVPTFANVPAAAVSHIAGQVFSLDDVTVADADSGNLSLTLNPSNGILLGLIDQDSTTAGTQISGTAAAINKALASAVFVGTSAGAASVAMTLKDLTNTSVANYPLTITAPASSTDSDGDGVINSLEAGDGNKDGIPDQFQANVASNATLTLVASSVQAIPPVDATTTISNFSNVSALGTLKPPTGMTQPGGVLSFNALVSAGKAEHFSILVAASLGVNGYWQQSTDGAWVNLASAINGGSITQVGDQTRLDFVITDGGAFDGDHLINGVIVDTGLVAYLTPGLVGMPPVLPDDGFWF